MGSKIRVLDEQTINQIAAGEVIENPASVVKELVDNALDAGATEICIEIKGGGRQLIRISDNGSGMSGDDALLCFERHATSKLSSIDDLHEIFTMGFRGEAIPSIASISKLTLLTCTHDRGAEGTMVLVEGGQILKACKAVRSPGTTFEVKSLFFNLPVRKKFQRSPAFDVNEVLKVVSKMALANPRVKFELISNEKTLLSLMPPAESHFEGLFAERIDGVLGRDFLQGCCYLDSSEGGYNIKGYIGLPSYSRHNRTGQYLFINRRPIYSLLVNNALREGYGTTLPSNRHPLFVLHLDMPGSLVDINVHPQKREVRLRQEQNLKRMIAQAVDSALQNSGIAPAPFFTEELFPQERHEITNSFAGYSFVKEPDFIAPSLPPSSFSTCERKPSFEQYRTAPAEEMPELFAPLSRAPNPKILGTLPRFILVDASSLDPESMEGLCLIDQRAAHCRIIFEKLIDQEQHQKIEVQPLLVPYTLEVTPLESAVLLDNLDLLNRFAIHLKEFGPHTFTLDAIPQIFGSIDMESFVRDLVKGLCEVDGALDIKQEKERRIAFTASRIAISNRVKLSSEEAQSLVKQLLLCKQPKLCPSGKPTMIHISSADLAKQFL